MSERTNDQNNSSRGVGQFGRDGEDSILSGRQSAPDATKILDRPPQSGNVTPESERCDMNKQSVVQAERRASDFARSAQRPPSASGERPPSAPGHRRRAVRHNVSDSYVDESLFGPVTDDMSAKSWQPKKCPVKPFIFDCTDYKAKANRSTNVPPSSRPPSQRSARSRPRSASLHSQPSFVDESLFGDQLEPSTWRAPWDKKEHRPKPLIFDASYYREKQQRDSTPESRQQYASSTGRGSMKRLPPWR